MTIFITLILNLAHANSSGCDSALRAPTARLLVAGVALTLVSATEPRPPVDLQLVLATDVSGSIDPEEYTLQTEGVARALEDPEVRGAITRCAPRGLALSFAEWGQSYTEVVPFRHVHDAASLDAFARAVRATPRARKYEETDLENGLRQSYQTMQRSDWTAGRRVIDVSSDGIQNFRRDLPEMKGAEGMHERVAQVRDEIVGADVTINALVLGRDQYQYVSGNPEATLEAYYREYVIGGPEAFTQTTQKFADFGQALQKKIAREVCAGINF